MRFDLEKVTGRYVKHDLVNGSERLAGKLCNLLDKGFGGGMMEMDLRDM